MKQHKNKIIIGVLVILVLALTYWWGGASPSLHGWTPTAQEVPQEEPTSEPTPEPAPEPTPEPAPEPILEPAPEPILDPTPEPILEPAPEPIEQPTPEPQRERTCTLSVRCDTVLDHPDWLAEETAALVPKDGVLYAAKEVAFDEGESVFDVLLREMRAQQIHLEFSETPMYDSVYIEGIGNLYEFDCGERSGWMYRVNGRFPNYGCSRYILQAGDVVEWIYTCDLGEDIGQ